MIEPYEYSEFVYICPTHEIEERILVELNKRPLTSYELSSHLGVGIHKILYWLINLKRKGNIRVIENGSIFYKLKKELKIKIPLKQVKQISISQDTKYQEIWFLKYIEKVDPHFRTLYNQGNK